MLIKEESKMNIAAHLIVTVLVLVLCVSCSKSPDPPVMAVYHDGNEYYIVERGDASEGGQSVYFVRYYSKDLGNEAALDAERADLYAIIAKHIDTNEHQRVTLIAVEEERRFFGLLKPREVRDSISAQEVLTYNPTGTNEPSEEQ